ncbi:MAG: hypothetical protein RMH97_09295, partial [Verrucomicrobiales bacterium]|nr:hypothetical protein [Verrucomicrobiales bacterium]
MFRAVNERLVPVQLLDKPSQPLRVERIRLAVGQTLPGSIELRSVAVVPRQFKVVWRYEPEGAPTQRNLRDSIELEITSKRQGQQSFLARLSYVEKVFERPIYGNEYNERNVAVWVDGNQVGYGELMQFVPMSSVIVSEQPAVVVLQVEHPLSPGLYRFKWGDLNTLLLVSPRLWPRHLPCVN